MEDDAKTFIAGTVSICLTVILIIGSIAGCTAVDHISDNKALVDMVKVGNDPLAAKCAINFETTTCSIMAAKK